MDKVVNKRNLIIGAIAATSAGIGFLIWYKFFRKTKEKEINKPPKVAIPINKSKEISEWYVDPELMTYSSLMKDAANARSRSITQVKYSLCLALNPGDSYYGYLEIEVTIGEISDGIYLDYFGSSLKIVQINGQDVPCDSIFYMHKISIPSKYQQVGKNTVFFLRDNNVKRYKFTLRMNTQIKRDYAKLLMKLIKKNIFIPMVV